MIKAMTLSQAAHVLDAQLVGDGDVLFSSIEIDSRKKASGALFVCIVGDNLDGHGFVNQAVENGAVAILTNRYLQNCLKSQLIVKDTTLALGDLAAFDLKSFKGPKVAITGSCGKTTTRSFLASILKTKYKVHQPEKNYNNHIGVPLTIFGLQQDHSAAVFELGCSDFFEIQRLTQIVDPDVGLITNVGPAHLEKLKDLKGVSRAKGELFDNLKSNSTAIINIDDPNVAGIPVKSKAITYSSVVSADVSLQKRQVFPDGQVLEIKAGDEQKEIYLPLQGRHNALNALAAAAAAWSLGISLEQVNEGLATIKPVSGRGELHFVEKGIIIDDTYNANPASMKAALDVLMEIPGNYHVAILGDMLELGENSPKAHYELGKLLAKKALDAVVLKGQWKDSVYQGAIQGKMNAKSIYLVEKDNEIFKIMSEISKKDTVLLLKGSRGMKLERVVLGLLQGF